jgi:ketosteroid isomerase-like protein
MLYRCLRQIAVTFLFAFIVASPSLAVSQGQLKTASQQELDVIKVLLKQEAAWDRGDIDGFLEGYKDSPDTLFINNLIQRGFEGMKADYHHNYPNKETMGQLTFSELEVHPIDDKVAVCVGKYKIERSKKNGGNAESIFSMVFQKTDAGWKIVVAHTT